MNLKGFLIRNKIEHEFIEKKSTHHAIEASKAAGIPLDKIVKTIVFLDDKEKPLIAIVRADTDVSRHKLESISMARKIRLAPENIAEHLTGYPTGGIPPVGHRRRIPVFLDEKVLENQYIWAGGGARTKLVKLNVQDIIRINKVVVSDISIRL